MHTHGSLNFFFSTGGESEFRQICRRLTTHLDHGSGMVQDSSGELAGVQHPHDALAVVHLPVRAHVRDGARADVGRPGYVVRHREARADGPAPQRLPPPPLGSSSSRALHPPCGTSVRWCQAALHCTAGGCVCDCREIRGAGFEFGQKSSTCGR